MSVLEFCNRHGACPEGRKWALANCRDMDHAWETLTPEWLTWVAMREGVLDDRTLRLFSVWCYRQVQHLMTDPRSVAAVDVAERFANGDATVEELKVARAAATATAWATSAAAWAAADAAASRAAASAAWTESLKLQAEWLRANAKPNWETKP